MRRIARFVFLDTILLWVSRLTPLFNKMTYIDRPTTDYKDRAKTRFPST